LHSSSSARTCGACKDWLWSYREQAFVCAGQARVSSVGFAGMFSDAQAPIARDALRMRALAIAADALRAVERPR
jgi:hypothetical protein